MAKFVVLVLHMAVHDNTSGHLQLVCLKLVKQFVQILVSVLVMLPSILPHHHLWVETISVNQDITQKGHI